MDELNKSEPMYILSIYLNNLENDTKKLYIANVKKQQKLVKKYLNGENVEIDSGFDIFTPVTVNISNGSISNKISMSISTSMSFNDKCCGYYLYPRSSMGAKTPLRLSNSVGIIDSGYRGEITAIVDNIDSTLNNNYIVKKNDRIVQICSPNLTYPIYPVIVDSISDLGSSIRGNNGFGSSGI